MARRKKRKTKGYSFTLKVAFEGSEFPTRSAAEAFVYRTLLPALKKLEAECASTSIRLAARRTIQ